LHGVVVFLFLKKGGVLTMVARRRSR
jgi:hypothetical protein